jgi:hypothetical protein
MPVTDLTTFWRIDGPAGVNVAGTYAITPDAIAFFSMQPLQSGATYTSYVYPNKLPRPPAARDDTWGQSEPITVSVDIK